MGEINPNPWRYKLQDRNLWGEEIRISKEKDEDQIKDYKACEILKSKHKTVSPSESEGKKRIREKAISLVAPILNARKASWSEKMFSKKNLQRKDDYIYWSIDHWLTAPPFSPLLPYLKSIESTY